MQTHTTVLIVGAGPVGLTLALDLQRQQIPFVLIDAALHPATTSRALGLHARTIELWDELGIGADIAALAQPVHAFSIYERGQCMPSASMSEASACLQHL
jgi:NADPH-dependent dioxygenase